MSRVQVPAEQRATRERCVDCHVVEVFDLDDVPEEFGWQRGRCPRCAELAEEADTMKEAAITDWFRQKLTELGAWVYKAHGSGMSRGGVPDLLVCYRGRFYGFEMKADDGEVSPRQRVEIDRINTAGGCALVVKGKEGARRMIEALRDHPPLRPAELRTYMTAADPLKALDLDPEEQ